jgi:hypothetical protein
MCWGYMGGSALAVGGGAPLSAASITVGPNPMAPGRRLSTLDAGPARSPGHALARLGHASATGSSARKRSAWRALGRAWSPGSAGKRSASSALRHATPRIGHASTGHATPERPTIAHNRHGRARPTSGRPGARTQHGASCARAGEACTILHHSGHKETRATHRLPGFDRIGRT